MKIPRLHLFKRTPASRGRFIIITGQSGAGKTSITKMIARKKNFARLVTCTTRPPRPGERDGSAYHFLSPTSFEAELARGEFFEWYSNGNISYGSRLSDLEKLRASGRDVLANLDIHGALKIKARWPDTLIIFVTAPIEELRARILKRASIGDAELKRRLTRAQDELAFMKSADFVVANSEGRLAAAVRSVWRYLDSV